MGKEEGIRMGDRKEYQHRCGATVLIIYYTVLKVAEIQRPIETNIFFGVGRCTKTSALMKVKRSRITEARPIIACMQQ